jgi:hypothetical protein
MRRRAFLRSGLTVSLVAVAGCSNGDSETPTGSSTATPTDTPGSTPSNTDSPADGTPTEEDEPELEDEEENPDAPANYRWDLESGRNDNIRTELDQYVDDPGSVRQDHPAFDFSTERETDDHTVDFEALRMIRDSNFDIFVNERSHEAPLEDMVEAFVDSSLYSDIKDDIYRSDTDSPSTYDEDAWLNADTVEESLDLGHNLLITIGLDGDTPVSNQETAVTIREAYQRHHDFDVLAWGVDLDRGAISQGMMYSPDDDKIRSFANFGEWYGGGEAQFHTEIQNWDVIADPDTDAYDLQHPILFHTDEWDRQGISFEDAKDTAVGMIYTIASEDYTSYGADDPALTQNITMTTGAAEQLTRTMLDYNLSGVNTDFSDIRDLASFAVGKYIENPELNGVIDTVEPEDDEYDEYFGGGFAFYEVDDEDIVDSVRTDQSHEYDHFGEVYDELDTAA